MSNIDKQALTDEAIKKAFAGTNFGRDDFKNILAETVIDAAAGWRCGYTATTICTHLGLLTPKGCASALGFRFISEHVQRETKRLKDELSTMSYRVKTLGGTVDIVDQQRDIWMGRCKDAEEKLEAAEKRSAELIEFLKHVKKCLVKNGEYAPLSHEEIDTLLGIRAAGIGVKGE